MMWLAIHKKSWHYRYYKKLHDIWGIDLKNNISTCKYSWMFFILSIFSFVLLPVTVLGWMFLKILRVFYQIMGKFSIGEKVIDFLDHHLEYGTSIESLTDDMNDAPIPMCCFIGVMGLAFLLICYSLLFCFVFGMSMLISNIASIPSLILSLILHIGWGFMWVFISIGFIMWVSLEYLYMFYIIFSPNIISFLISSIKWLPIVTGIFFTMFLFVYGMICFFDTKYGQKFINYVSLKFNGFQVARAETITRRQQYKEEQVKRVKVDTPQWVSKKKENKPIFFKRWYKVLKEFFFTGKNKKYKNRDFTVLGFFPLAWETIKSLKDGVCPFIEFIDDEEEEENVEKK